RGGRLYCLDLGRWLWKNRGIETAVIKRTQWGTGQEHARFERLHPEASGRVGAGFEASRATRAPALSAGVDNPSWAQTSYQRLKPPALLPTVERLGEAHS